MNLAACTRLLAVFTLAMLVPSVVMADESDDSTKQVVRYTVNSGDTLGSIALRFNVGIGEVKAWNNLEDLHIEPGKQLIVKSEKKVEKKKEPLPVIHVIKRGDTFEKIAKSYRVSTKQIKRWNRRLNPRTLQIGQRVRLYIPGREGHSVSWGSANRGRLYNGVALETSDVIRVRHVSRAYGTERTIKMLEAATADVQARWPDSPTIVVGDISYKRGGRMRPHKSHQSGRDADLSYYHKGGVLTRDFVEMTPETFDAVKNWHLFKTLIDTEQVEYIFVDYRLQKELFLYAKSIGYTEQELAPILQYPNGARARTGIIRHARGHDDHFHIRFYCGPKDKRCR